jgi:tetratricopeptide (TPR) repeat protein
MARPFEPASSPRARLLGRIDLDAPLAPPEELILRVAPGDRVLEEFRPLPLNLEWRLSELHWLHEGVTSFITSDVPYHVNNNGRASAAAAAVLFANCVEAPADGDAIRALEIGAGSALFARYFLDEFRDRCLRHGRDFYDRLVFHVTDRSPGSVRHWTECGVFGEHAGHVVASVCDAGSSTHGIDALPIDGPLRVVFANYVLDSLPAAVLRRTPHGWEQLCVRASIRDDVALPNALADRSVDWMREAARSDRSDDLLALLPLLPMLDAEATFRPIEGEGPPDWERYVADAGEGREADATAAIYNYGALRCLDRLLPRLHAAGFLLVRDFTTKVEGERSRVVGAQRFGASTAMPLNFPLIERHLRGRGVEMITPVEDRLIHTRLLTAAPIAGTRQTFVERFGEATPDVAALEARARAHAESGLWREALDVYREAIVSDPRDWQLIGAAAHFAATRLRDPASGLGLARAALQLNPWYSPALWNVLGDCLVALDRQSEGHGCYGEALRLHPRNPETHLRLATSWLQQGEAERSLESVAHGLAADVDASYRHLLLETQQAAIDAIARRAIGQREVTHRRRVRQDMLASDPRSPGK